MRIDQSEKVNVSLILIGGGGHSKVLIEAARSSRYKIHGIIDNKMLLGETVLGIPIIGKDENLSDPSIRKMSAAIGIGSIRGDDKRKNIFQKLSQLDFQLPIIRHNNTTVSENVLIGRGTQIMAGVVIQPDVKIGDNCILNTSAVIEHDCKIASHSHIAPGAVIGGGVSIGECTLVGLGARLLHGIKIGSFVTIGAGAVVVDDVPDHTIAVGIPAKIIQQKK